MVQAVNDVAGLESGDGDDDEANVASEAEMFDAAVAGETPDSGESGEDRGSEPLAPEPSEPEFSGRARDPATGKFVSGVQPGDEPGSLGASSDTSPEEMSDVDSAIPDGNAQTEDVERMHGASAQVPSWRLAEETTRRREAEAAAVQLAETVNALQAQAQFAQQQQMHASSLHASSLPELGQVAPSVSAEGSAGPFDASGGPSGEAARDQIAGDQVAHDDVTRDQVTNEIASDEVSSQIAHGLQTMRLENAMARAQDRYGDETFGEAYLHLMNSAQSGDAASYARVMNAPDPGEAIMQWHNERRLLQETGGDPNAYRQRIAGELRSDPAFRQEVLAALRNEAQGNGQSPAHHGTHTTAPNTLTQVPPSLSTLPGGGGSPHSGSDGAYDEEALFKQAIGPLRGLTS